MSASKSRIEQLQEATQFLAGVCDGAVDRDGQGFNAVDVAFGHSLAMQDRWSIRQAEYARRLLKKYTNQLTQAGFDLDLDTPLQGDRPRSGNRRGRQNMSKPDWWVESHIDEGYILLGCPYNANSDVKRAFGRPKFDKETKGWRISLEPGIVRKLENFCNVPEDLQRWESQHEERFEQLLQLRNWEDAEISVDTPDGLELYPFQRVGVRFIESAQTCILGDDMGLGKTAQAIIAAKQIDAQQVLVICPASLKTNWAREVRKWDPDAIPVVVQGTLKQRQQQYVDFRQIDDRRYLIVNYELTRAYMERDNARVDLPDLPELLKLGFDEVVIVDEAHRIKNRKALQTEGVKKLARECTYRWLLTGTSVQNRVTELWSLLNTLDPGKYSSYWAFAKEHADARPGYYGWEVNDYATDPEALRRELVPYYIRRLKKDHWDEMPEKVYHKLWVSLHDEQQQPYLDIEQDMLTELDDGELLITPIVLTQILRMKQIAVSPELIDISGPSTKMDALIDVVTGTDQKIVVFSQFAKGLKVAEKYLNQAGISWIKFTGKTKDPDAVVQEFQTNPDKQVLLTTIQAGGEGYTMTAASAVIFLDKHWTPAVNEQAVDRVHRYGQESSAISIIEILAENTVEEWIEELLERKQNIVNEITRTDVQEFFGKRG